MTTVDIETLLAHDDLRSLIEALDGWLSTGGFLPKRWHPAYEPTRSS